MFSKDGRYMASAGQFCNVHVWKVLDHDSKIEEEEDETIHVFEDTPLREYRGHLADILDISWSKVYSTCYVISRVTNSFF